MNTEFIPGPEEQAQDEAAWGCPCQCPAFLILSPQAGESLVQLEEIVGRGIPGAVVYVYIGRELALCTCTDPCGFWHVQNPYRLSAGSQTVKAQLFSCSCCQQACVQFYVRGEMLPAPTIGYPANGAVITERMPLVLGLAAPGNTATVCLKGRGCKDAAVGADGRFGLRFPLELPDGSYTITATQRDVFGNQSAAAESMFTVTGTAPLPAPVILNPASGAVITERQPLISGLAQTGNTVLACLSGQGCQESVAENGAFSLRFPALLSPGSYTISVSQRNFAGQVSPRAQSTFTVSGPSPLTPPTIDAPAGGAVIQERQPVISGIAREGNIVRVCLLGVGCQETVAGTNGVYNVQFAQILPDAVYRITALQRDEYGNASSENQSVFTVSASSVGS